MPWHILAERFYRIETKFPIRQKTALAIHRTAGRSCFPIFLYQHCRNQKPPTLISLFFLYIFQTVKGYGCQDNDTFKDELKVCINTQNRQRVGQRGKDQYTRYNSGNLTDTTGKGNTANYAGCDGIHIPSLSISCTAGTNHTVTFQPGAEAIQDTCQDKCSHRYFEYRNTRYCCCFRISAYRIQVFTKCCFIPDKPYNDNCCNCPQDDRREFADLRNEGVRDRKIDGTEGYTLGSIGYQTKNDQHIRHCRNKRVHFESCHEEAGNHGKYRCKDHTH